MYTIQTILCKCENICKFADLLYSGYGFVHYTFLVQNGPHGAETGTPKVPNAVTFFFFPVHYIVTKLIAHMSGTITQFNPRCWHDVLRYAVSKTQILKRNNFLHLNIFVFLSTVYNLREKLDL